MSSRESEQSGQQEGNKGVANRRRALCLAAPVRRGGPLLQGPPRSRLSGSARGSWPPGRGRRHDPLSRPSWPCSPPRGRRSRSGGPWSRGLYRQARLCPRATSLLWKKGSTMVRSLRRLSTRTMYHMLLLWCRMVAFGCVIGDGLDLFSPPVDAAHVVLRIGLAYTEQRQHEQHRREHAEDSPFVPRVSRDERFDLGNSVPSPAAAHRRVPGRSV